MIPSGLILCRSSLARFFCIRDSVSLSASTIINMAPKVLAKKFTLKSCPIEPVLINTKSKRRDSALIFLTTSLELRCLRKKVGCLPAARKDKPGKGDCCKQDRRGAFAKKSLKPKADTETSKRESSFRSCRFKSINKTFGAVSYTHLTLPTKA